MLPRSTTKHENGQTIPLSGGARAVRPGGGLWSRERTDPPRRSATAVALRHPLHGGDFHRSWHTAGDAV